MSNPNPQPAPLDLAQDERFNTDGQLDNLVAEVQRQREELARLRGCLTEITRWEDTAGFTAVNLGVWRQSIICAARAALAAGGQDE